MIFGKKDHLVGLDIGSSCIKVAELKVTGKGHILQKFGMTQIASGAIVEGRIVDMASLADDIRALFKSQKIREKNVAISTGGHSVVIKTISTSTKSEKELHETIYSEAEQYIPYDIDDVNIDYQILGESEFSADQMSVLLVAVKKDLVAEYIDLIHMAGLTPKIIDVDTFALQNAYEMLPYENHEKTTLLVDVGASKTSLNIIKANSSLMMRDTVSGTNQLLEEITSQFDVTIDEAEKAVLIARISRGRTIREIMLAVGVIAPIATHFWFTILGGTGIFYELAKPGVISGPLKDAGLPAALMAVVGQLPMASLLIPLFLILIFLFLATTGDSMSLSIAICVTGEDDPPRSMRVFWAITMGAVAAILIKMGSGGIGALQSFIVITAVPVGFIMLPTLWGGVNMARKLYQEQNMD